jgi:5-methylcytosine-specific restriction endonuclease McrA
MSVKKHIKQEEKGGVLVLNSSYEPIGTTPLTRAMLKIGKGAYYVEEWSTAAPLHSANGSVERPKPSVVRLKSYLDLPKLTSKGMRSDIYKRDKHKCQYCSKKFPDKELTLDHVFPKSRGGSNEATNLVTACKACNNRKGDRTPAEARMPLVNTLNSYKANLHRVRLCHYVESRPEWAKYLFLDSNGDSKFANVA